METKSLYLIFVYAAETHKRADNKSNVVEALTALNTHPGMLEVELESDHDFIKDLRCSFGIPAGVSTPQDTIAAQGHVEVQEKSEGNTASCTNAARLTSGTAADVLADGNVTRSLASGGVEFSDVHISQIGSAPLAEPRFFVPDRLVQAAINMSTHCLRNSALQGRFTVGSDYQNSHNVAPDGMCQPRTASLP